MARLKTAQRDALPAGEFALPEKRQYPVNDAEHARKALQLDHNATPAERKKIEAAVHRRFPEIGSYRKRD